MRTMKLPLPSTSLAMRMFPRAMACIRSTLCPRLLNTFIRRTFPEPLSINQLAFSWCSRFPVSVLQNMLVLALKYKGVPINRFFVDLKVSLDKIVNKLLKNSLFLWFGVPKKTWFGVDL